MVKPEIKALLKSWKITNKQPNNLVTLINCLPRILPHLEAEVAAGTFAPHLSETASPSEVSKLLFRRMNDYGLFSSRLSEPIFELLDSYIRINCQVYVFDIDDIVS